MNQTNSSKQNWNAAHYTQVKVSVAPKIAVAFKAACKHANVSMSSQLSTFMIDHAKILVERMVLDKFNTRQKRRKAINLSIKQVEEIRDAKDQYKDNIPQNLQSSAAYDDADQCISRLEDALEALSMAY